MSKEVRKGIIMNHSASYVLTLSPHFASDLRCQIYKKNCPSHSFCQADRVINKPRKLLDTIVIPNRKNVTFAFLLENAAFF